MGTTELYTHRVDEDIRQSVWNIKRTFNIDGHKVRVTLHNDPYKFQADYYVELFNPRDLKWNRAHTASTDEWYHLIDCLGLERMTHEQSEYVEMLISMLVTVAQELLEGVPA